MKSGAVKELRKLFGNRITFDKTERKLYSHDIAAVPNLIKPFIGSAIPDVVVQPQSEEEIVTLMKRAAFEAMIALMTPRGFADLMSTMWLELIAAMPFGMGGMMRLMGKIPGALTLMKPMFPVLFPILLPMMMPKVMSTMLARVAERVPMPDYMAEQMPELMPKVMDNLMPHMIGDLVPLITQPMIDYLRGKGSK